MLTLNELAEWERQLDAVIGYNVEWERWINSLV